MDNPAWMGESKLFKARVTGLNGRIPLQCWVSALMLPIRLQISDMVNDFAHWILVEFIQCGVAAVLACPGSRRHPCKS